MSIQAIAWAIEDAPDVPAQCVAVLVALANRANEDGRDAYPSVDRLAHAARKSERSVQRDLDTLESLKLIRKGDQRAVFRFRPDRRPTVWDLAMELRRPAYKPKWQTESEQSATPGRGDVDVTALARGDIGAERGDVHVVNGVTPASPKPSLEPSLEQVSSSRGNQQRGAAPSSPRPRTAELDPAPVTDGRPPAELGGPGHTRFLAAREALAARRPRGEAAG